MARDLYGRLGLRRTATKEEIKRAYRRLAKKLHPDVDPSREAHERFLAVKEAYEVLSNPLLRREYDERQHGIAPLWDMPPPPTRPRVIRVSPPFAVRERDAYRIRTATDDRRRRQLSFLYTAAVAGSSVAFLAGAFLLVALGGLVQGVLSFAMGLTLVLLLMHVFPFSRR